MIVRDLPTGQLLCIHQTSHALMAEEFCRHWGNQEFARPQPYSAVMVGIAQHDNGWYEWEMQPKLRADGYPQDFLHESDLAGKLQLWRRGISRLAAQHPYAGLLLSRHAVLLYEGDLKLPLPDEIRQQTEAFIREQRELPHTVRRHFRGDTLYQPALADAVIEANTWLLKFGDSASLQVIVPWKSPTTLPKCPVDFAGTYTAMQMTFDDAMIAFDPWPFGVDAFAVSVHGKLLDQRHFSHEVEYHRALAQAPYQRMTWNVVRP
jgi:hypothetical protein